MYGCDVTAIVISCLWKQLFAVGIVSTKLIMQSAYTSAIKWLLLKWNGCDCDVSMHDWVLLLSCDSLKFDQYCQLSGSRKFEFTRPLLLWPGNKARGHHENGSNTSTCQEDSHSAMKHHEKKQTFFVEWANWH